MAIGCCGGIFDFRREEGGGLFGPGPGVSGIAAQTASAGQFVDFLRPEPQIAAILKGASSFFLAISFTLSGVVCKIWAACSSV